MWKNMIRKQPHVRHAEFNMKTVYSMWSHLVTCCDVWNAHVVPTCRMWTSASGIPHMLFFHVHCAGDTMTVLDADDLDLSTIIWATVAYVTANLDDLLPRTGEYPSAPPATEPPPASGSTSHHVIGRKLPHVHTAALLLAGTLTVVVRRSQ